MMKIMVIIMSNSDNRKFMAAEALKKMASLTVWRSLLNSAYLTGVRDFCHAILKEDAVAQINASAVLQARLLSSPLPLSLAETIFEELLFTDTPFSLSAGDVDFRVRAASARDLAVLRELLDMLDGLALDMVFPMPGFHPTEARLFAQFMKKEAEELTAGLENYYLRCGSGIFAKHRGFILRDDKLVGVRPDEVTFADLIGYEREREMVVDNTLALLEGRPANNMLLYGDRGTGKSTTVKALLNEYGDRGLRMVQLTCDQLFSLPDIIATLEQRHNTFIIFIDDLSYEKENVGFTALKSVLEGGLAARPDNVAIYATTNRRHLISERFSERNGDDVNAADTMQEKLSLADRFGITVTFSTPDQEGYVKIVFGLLEQRGLSFDKEQVRQAAIRWEMRQNGLSPRTARQFADWQEAKLKETAAKLY